MSKGSRCGEGGQIIIDCLVCSISLSFLCSRRDLWGIYASENSFFGIFISHSNTISRSIAKTYKKKKNHDGLLGYNINYLSI